MGNYKAILLLSGITTLISILLSTNVIMNHRKSWTSPVQQTSIVKIILMAPIFALDSFVGILELEKGEVVAHILDMIKECYEAVVIHSFLTFMYDQCGLGLQLQRLPEGIKGRELHVPFPVGLLFKHAYFDLTWLHRLKFWTSQFII